MKTNLTLTIIIIGASIATAEQATFNSILGEAEVKAIVTKVVANVTDPKDERYPRVTVEPELSARVVALAGNTTVSSSTVRSFVADRLTQGVTLFFEHYRDFMLERSKEKHLALDLTSLEAFFDWVQKSEGCGKVPCYIPPCCGACDGCEQDKLPER